LNFFTLLSFQSLKWHNYSTYTSLLPRIRAFLLCYLRFWWVSPRYSFLFFNWDFSQLKYLLSFSLLLLTCRLEFQWPSQTWWMFVEVFLFKLSHTSPISFWYEFTFLSQTVVDGETYFRWSMKYVKIELFCP